MATDLSGGFDEQDQSELFDEDRLEPDDSGSPRAEMKTFEELPDVLDVTQAVGDADNDAALFAEELDDDEIIDLEADADATDIEDDELAARMPEGFDDDSQGPLDAEEALLDVEIGLDDVDRQLTTGPSEEVELVYAGDLDDVVEDVPETELEAEVLADDDIEDLGYGAAEGGDGEERVRDGSPGSPTKFEIGLRNHVWTLTRDGKPVHD